jgi:hypothetical protein
LGVELVLRWAQQESAEFAKKLRALNPELVLRDIPGKSMQRRSPPQALCRLGSRALE